MILGKKIIRYRSLDSTNNEARRLIKQGEGEGLVVIAETQTRGKGKPGFPWHSPKGNLYLSAVVKPYRQPKETVPLTLLAALAGRAAITGLTGLPVVIKWPNDLVVRGKKIGGILTERTAGGHLIIGIGINLDRVPPEVARTATALRVLTGKRYDLKKFSAALIAALDREYRSFLKLS